MPGIRNPLIINDVPVVTTPAEIDVTTAEQLHMVLLRATARGQALVVVDMTRTRFCDSAGLTVLVRAHKRALADGGELRLIITPDGAVARILAITRLDCVIPLFGRLEEALASRPTASPAAVIRPLRPQRSARRSPGRFPRSSGRGALISDPGQGLVQARPARSCSWAGAVWLAGLPRLRRCQAARMSAPPPVTAANVVMAVNSVVATATRPIPMTGTETPR